MKINLLKKRFIDYDVLYAPEFKMEETPTVAEECYPAVRINPQFDPEYFYLLISEVGEYEEYSNHPEKGQIMEYAGGREQLEAKFSEMAKKI